ncbi:efflux RND transporter permease subunit, partial [Bacteroidales bacterium OttesenSCG-928-C19]|nr:efflux RND transporter permease subunit [Bacteroidales bacterium OttesenSCG-928-C19]
NVSVITVQYEYGTDMDEAANDVRAKIEMAKQALPDNAETPIVFKFSSDMMPIMYLSATAKESFNGLYKLLDDQVANPLNRISGVGSVFISGAPEREIQINCDPQKLQAYNITVEQIGSVIAQENLNVPVGTVDIGSETFSVRVEGEFTESDQIKNVIVGSYGGKNIYIKDVASVKDTLKERAQEVFVNGEKGGLIIIQKQSGGNDVQICKKIRETLPELQENLPPDVNVEIMMDSSEFIEGSINSLMETVLLAFLFVMIVVLFFLGRWRATIIIIITIPVSLLAAFIYLMITGNTLNIISLSSLSIAIGMVVDDAIVVLENITSHIERGSRPREAAIYGTNEVSVAVIASTLTIVAVFMPFTMVSGLAGIMFSQLGWIVTIVMIVSTAAALTLTPTLSSKMLRLNPKRSRTFDLVYMPIERFLTRLDNAYGKILKWALGHRAATLLIAVGLFISSLFLLNVVGTEFIPSSDNSQIGATIELPVGTRVEDAKEIMVQIREDWEAKYPEVERFQYTVGQADGSNAFASMSASGSHIVSVTLRLADVEDRKRDIFEISDLMRKDLEVIPEIYRYEVNAGGSRGGGMTGGSTVDVEILGYDFATTDRLSQQVKELMAKNDGLRDIKISREDYAPQLQIVFDRDKLAMHGLNMATVANFARNRINGLLMSMFRDNGEEYDIYVRYDPEYRVSIEDINDIIIYNNAGKGIKLSELGQVVETFAPPAIEHLNRERVIKVTGTVYGSDLGTVVANLKKGLKDIDFPLDVAYKIGGSYEDQQDSFGDLGLLLVLVIILVYIVMAAQFESLKDPFIIMLSLPFAFTGVFIALWLTGKPLSMLALIGAIMLVGIVVKNGIVLIDYINLNRERGMSVFKAVITGGKSRLRPVLMTTMTTILGMFPMALALGEGSELWQPMGIAIIGGLTISTLLTLIVIPVVYSLFRPKKYKSSIVVED